jgi:hypothetical protein
MNQHLDNVSVKTVSVMDGRVSLHYQFRKKADFNRTEFVKNLNTIAGSDRVEIFLGGALSA